MISRETAINSNLLIQYAIKNGGNTSYTLSNGRDNSVGGFYVINDGSTDVDVSFDIGDTTITVTTKADEGQGFNVGINEKGKKFTITATGNYRIYFFTGV